MRVPMNPETLEAITEPEHVSAGLMADDFCIDEDAGVAYLATHRENTLIASHWIQPRTANALSLRETPAPMNCLGQPAAPGAGFPGIWQSCLLLFGWWRSISIVHGVKRPA